jgi:hypothetical protein
MGLLRQLDQADCSCYQGKASLKLQWRDYIPISSYPTKGHIRIQDKWIELWMY